jgi:hypothetical protein
VEISSVQFLYLKDWILRLGNSCILSLLVCLLAASQLL